MRTAIAKLVTQDPQPISAACGITYLPSVVIGNFGLQLRSLPNEQQNASFRGHGVPRHRGACRSPAVGWGRFLAEHRPPQRRHTLRDPRHSCSRRSDLLRGSAQGRSAGGMTATRRLAAILAADVAGYSRLIGVDEGGTLQALKSIRAELIDPTIAAHNGRLVKTTGDGLLVEFGSVVDALRCATEVQAGMAQRNAGAPADKRIDFRIGINMGDVVVEDGDIFGDGVNVAARLEGLAEPGGICVSARVQEDAAGKLDLTFEDLGEQALKNITRPVRAYRIATGAVSATKAEPPALALPDKPSIAVLPFQNMSGDPEQEYFADGMVEEIITALSRIRW